LVTPEEATPAPGEVWLGKAGMVLSKQGGLGLKENTKPIAAGWGSAPLQETAASLSPTRHRSNQQNATQKLTSASDKAGPSELSRAARGSDQRGRSSRHGAMLGQSGSVKAASMQPTCKKQPHLSKPLASGPRFPSQREGSLAWASPQVVWMASATAAEAMLSACPWLAGGVPMVVSLAVMLTCVESG
jgi:hypothetical protein